MLKRNRSKMLLLGGMVILLLAVAGGGASPAWAGKCKYLGGTSDNGPCVEVRNELLQGWGIGPGVNLWCAKGPTANDHKIVLRPGDSFTCKDKWFWIQRDPIGCSDKCFLGSPCGNGKAVYKVISVASGDSLRHSCH